MIVLSKRQVILLHKDLIDQTGGIEGLRDEGLLDSALSAPFQSFEDQVLYPSLYQKAARLAFGLVKNHPFLDGNSALMLVCARLRHVAGTQWGSKKYMNMKHLEAMEQESLVG